MVKAERTAEHEQPRLERAGASALLLLGGTKRSDLTKPDETKLKNIFNRHIQIPRTLLNHGARVEQENYYHNDYQDGETEEQTRDRRMKRWTSHVDGILAKYDNSPAEGFLQKMGINKEKGATEMYEKYIVEGESDIVAFAYEILDTHSALDIKSNMSVIRTISGNLYGKESGKIVEELVIGMIEGKEDPIRFINAAKEQLKMPDMPGKEIIHNLAVRNGEQDEESASSSERTITLRPDMEPEEFKRHLINNLSSTAYGAQAWKIAQSEHDMSLDDVTIVHHTIKSRSYYDVKADKQLIDLGIGQMAPHERQELHFEPPGHPPYSYEREVTHRFLHEIAHKINPVLEENYPNYSQLFNFIQNLRIKSNQGISTLGNLDFYKKLHDDLPPRDQAKAVLKTRAAEDLTELVTMYLIDPTYLRKFMDFLTDPQEQEEKNKYRLLQLDKKRADEIYRIIHHAVSDLTATK